MRLDNEDAETFEMVMPGRRQRQAIADPLTLLVRSGDHIKRKSKVGGVSRHWTDHRKIALAWHRRRGWQAVSAKRNQAKGWLVPEDSTEMRRHTYRSPDIRSDRKRAETGRERRGRPARGSAGRAAEVPGIVRGSINIVVTLELAKARRNVGFADNDGSGLPQPRGSRRSVHGVLPAVLFVRRRL